MATDTSAFAYLVGDWFTKNSGVVVYQTPTFAHCLPVSGTIGSLGLAANYAVIGGPETSVQFWDLYAKAAVPYALKNPRALSPGLATRDGNSLAVGQGLGMPVLAYATASGVTLERVDLRSGTALRAATLDLPLDPSLLSLRTLSLETVGRGLLLTLFGIGPAATNGQLPGTLRLVLLRVESDFEIAADVSYGLGDGPYDGPRYDVVDPSVSEPWYELVFMRAVGGTLREGRVRYCTAL